MATLTKRPQGNCYEVANILAGWGPEKLIGMVDGFAAVHDDIDSLVDGGDLDLSQAVAVHGFPTLRRPPFKRYGHAWVEVGDTVIDASIYPAVSMDKDTYYRLGNINDDDVTEYDQFQLLVNMKMFEHYGPWAASNDGEYMMREDEEVAV